MPNIKSIGWMVSKCRREGSDFPPPPPILCLCVTFLGLYHLGLKQRERERVALLLQAERVHIKPTTVPETTGVSLYFLFYSPVQPTLRDCKIYGCPLQGEEVTVHNTGISRFLLISVCVLLSPTIWCRETRPITRRPCPRTVWRKKVSPGVSQSSTVYQAGDWTWNFLVVSQRSYQLC